MAIRQRRYSKEALSQRGQALYDSGIRQQVEAGNEGKMERILILQHLHVMPHGSEDIKMIGVFENIQQAHYAIKQLSNQPSFSSYPEIIDPLSSDERSGFYIDEYQINKIHWKEGYVTV
ncbi:hypothetical protein V2H45_03915 [Tumidithrix elongata RA019]|uniref:Uncharacterized protein n=1 Tax=Tumidithrix elongata BACA0141 TaxID=2716417 RepID=A0AAW9PWC1_9CYAN|nr:hypothetical protein [Tumidithrix elongata RA019]